MMRAGAMARGLGQNASPSLCRISHSESTGSDRGLPDEPLALDRGALVDDPVDLHPRSEHPVKLSIACSSGRVLGKLPAPKLE